MDNTGELWAQVLHRIGDLHNLRDQLDNTIKGLAQLAFDAQCSIAGVVPRKSQKDKCVGDLHIRVTFDKNQALRDIDEIIHRWFRPIPFTTRPDDE